MCGHANSCDRIRCSKSDSIQLPSCLLHELPSSPAADAVLASPQPAMAVIRTCSYALIRSDDRPVPPAPMQPLPASTNIRRRPKSPAAFSTVSQPTTLPFSPFCSLSIQSNWLQTTQCSFSALHRLPQLTDAHAVCHSTAAHGRPGRGDHLLQARIGLSLENIVLCLVAANPGKSRLRTSLTDFDGTPGGKVWAQTG